MNNNDAKMVTDIARYNNDGSSASVIPLHVSPSVPSSSVVSLPCSSLVSLAVAPEATSCVDVSLTSSGGAASTIVTAGIDWTPEKTERLINLFENEVPLWNTKHPRHLDREERRVALLRISKDLKIAPAEIEKKLRGLRSYYSRELSKIQESVRNCSAPDGVYTSPWVFFTRLGFLNEFVHPRPPKRTPESFYVDLADYSKSTQEFDSEETDSAITYHPSGMALHDSPLEESERSCSGAMKREHGHNNNHQGQSHQHQLRDDEREDMDSFSGGNNCLLAESSSVSPPPLKRKARYGDSISAVDDNILYPAIRMVHQSDVNTDVDDEDLCFGRHVALSLKKMTHWTKELAKLQIQQVLYKCYFSQSPDVVAALSQHQTSQQQQQQQQSSRTLSPSPSTSSDYSSF